MKPLWQLLIERGLASSESEARGWILAGKVLVADRPVDKAGQRVSPAADVRLRGRRIYASRGGHKLEAALDAFAIVVERRVALDAGASTGGFTDCLLARGAGRVYAVDVGYGQLLGRLRQDPRVINLERTNLAEVGPAALLPPPTLLTLDLSYLPLAKAWRTVAPWVPDGADVVSLVKPLFEVDDARSRRTGVIEGPAPYVALLRRLMAEVTAVGWEVRGLIASPIRGAHGTLEFLLHARTAAPAPPAEGPPGGPAAGATRAPDPAAVVAAAFSPGSEASDLPPPRPRQGG